MSHDFKKMNPDTESKSESENNFITFSIIVGTETEIKKYPRVPFFSTYRNWDDSIYKLNREMFKKIYAFNAYKNTPSELYYVKQNIKKILKNVSLGSPIVWRPHFWGILCQAKKTTVGKWEMCNNQNAFDQSTLMAGNGHIAIYNDNLEELRKHNIDGLSVHDGALSNGTDYGLRKILENNTGIYVVWKWSGTNERYDETNTFYGYYDFSDDGLEPTSEKLKIVKQNIENLRDPNKKRTVGVKDVDSVIENIKKEIENIKKEIEHIKKEIEQRKQAIEQRKQENEKRKQEIEQRKQEIEKDKRDIEDRKQIIESLNISHKGVIETCNLTHTFLVEDRKTATTHIVNEINNELQNNNDEIDKYNRLLEENKNLIESADQYRYTIETERGKLETERGNLETERCKLETERGKLETEKSNLETGRFELERIEAKITAEYNAKLTFNMLEGEENATPKEKKYYEMMAKRSIIALANAIKELDQVTEKYAYLKTVTMHTGGNLLSSKYTYMTNKQKYKLLKYNI